MSLKDVLIDEMRDLYSAENQILKSMPKTIKKVSDSKLKEVLTQHHGQTKEQVLRLREAFEHLGKKPTGKHCSGTEGCLQEVKEAREEDEEGALRDAGILGAALRTEHYEVAGYSAAIAIAKALKETEVVKLLTETLQEEQAAAKNILASGNVIFKEAASDKDDEEDDKKYSDDRESKKKSEQDEAEAEPELKGKGEGRKTAKKASKRFAK